MTDSPKEREAGGPWALLRRRKVVQWGIAYAAAAWTLLQVVEYLGETYDWPSAVRQIGTLALALGSLVVLVVAWYHGDKGEQRVSRAEFAILAALIAFVGGTLWWYVSRMDESAWLAGGAAPVAKPAAPVDSASVAVLPFVNMSEDPANEYFSLGLSEEILNALAGIPQLYVPSRTSSFQFKGKSGDVAAFAAKLGVATILEGSVRKSGKRVRITAQLVHASDGYRIWSQTFDRELQDIFAIQSEIADAIAAALRVRLTTEPKVAASQAPPTTNVDAYEAYLLGHQALASGSPAKAVEYLQTAVDLDPQFAVAYADLALATLENSYPAEPWKTVKWMDQAQAALADARTALEKAEAISPERAEVLATAGYLDWWDGSNYERALSYYEKSLAVNPSNGEVLTWRTMALEKLGYFDRLLSATYEAVKRDPLSLTALSYRIRTLLQSGRRAEVGPLVERVRALNEARGQRWLAVIASGDGDLPAALRYCIAVVQAGGRDDCFLDGYLALGFREEIARRVLPVLEYRGFCEFEKAVPLARTAYREDPQNWEWYLVKLLWFNGEFKESSDLRQQAWGHFMVDFDGTQPDLLLISADAARRSGALDDAQRLRDMAAERLEALEKAAAPFRPGNYTDSSDWQYALLDAFDGREDEAAAHLVAGIRVGSMWRDALAAPIFAEIRERPDFQAAMREQRAILDRQRREVLEILCGPGPLPEKLRPEPATCARRDKAT